MRKNHTSINVFVSHPFKPDNGVYDLEKFRTNIKLLLAEAESLVRKEHNDFELDTTFEFVDFQNRLPTQIKNSIAKSHFALVDVTENNPNIFFEYGLMKGLNIPALLIKTNESFGNFDLPADMKDEIAVRYENFDELRKKCLHNIVALFKGLLKNDFIYKKLIDKIWFNTNSEPRLSIVVSSIQNIEENTASAADYLFLENLGDKGALLDIMTFLSRLYPNIEPSISQATDFDNHEGNIVVLGGPGDESGYCNSLCATMMEKIDSKFSYSEDCEVLLLDGKTYKAQKKDNRISIDYGYFARFPNPFNPKYSVVLIHGIHTFGVWGAAKAFSYHTVAHKNVKTVMEKFNLNDINDSAFECFFKVKIQNLHNSISKSYVECPKISSEDIFPLKF
ncbi:hypothetical protein [Roseivirga echinicomitans]|nr:hypothetical protein [Roseivirga echinicomitans]